jgi:hypothetical protein
MIVAIGYFTRKSDRSRQQRYQCKNCRKCFSDATFELCYWQKKRSINPEIFKSLVSGVSQRRLSLLLLGVDRKTIVRKFLFLGGIALELFLEQTKQYPPCGEIEFDDLETFEHSKLKPLSVVMAVESKNRRILGFRVARMSAKGLIAAKSRKKYGKRIDERAWKRSSLFNDLQTLVTECAIIKSDENPHYLNTVKTYFPKAHHKKFEGRTGCVVGQGELKSGGFDPLFSLNHSFAMLRANINRLFRRTWNTTKKPERLGLPQAHRALEGDVHLK